MDFFCVILIDRASLISATRSRALEPTVMDPNPLVWNIFFSNDNAAVVIDQEGNPKGTRVFGAIARELRELNFTKIVSLAPEVL